MTFGPDVVHVERGDGATVEPVPDRGAQVLASHCARGLLISGQAQSLVHDFCGMVAGTPAEVAAR